MLLTKAADASAQPCQDNGVALQILGSNLAAHQNEWCLRLCKRPEFGSTDGVAFPWTREGDAFLRFAEARGRFNDLALIAISNLHPDHVSDLRALLWGDTVGQPFGASMLVPKTPLPIAGPSGNADAPDFRSFLQHYSINGRARSGC